MRLDGQHSAYFQQKYPFYVVDVIVSGRFICYHG